MGAPGLTTGLRPETFENLQLNAGCFIKNLAYKGTGAPTDSAALKTLITGIMAGTVTGKGDIIGATRGGGTFVITREIREPDIDGRRYPFKGGKFVDSADARLTTTLVEITVNNILMALGMPASAATTSGKVTTIKMHTAIDPDDYIENLCWVGDLADGRMILICLKNALNTADFNLTFTDKNEGTLPVEIHAHQANVDDYDEAPFEIVYFDNPATTGGNP